MPYRTTFILGVLSLLIMTSKAEESYDTYHKRTLDEYNKYRGLLKNESINGSWLGDRYVFKWENEDGKKDFFSVSKRGEKKPLFDHDLLAKKIAEITKKQVHPANLPIRSMREKNNELELKINKIWYLWNGQELTQSEKKASNGNSNDVSPDGKWRARVNGGKLFLEEIGKDTTLLVDDGSGSVYFMGVRWAPDSKKFVVSKVNKGQRRQVSIIESTPKDQLQPKLHTFGYDKPGDIIDVAKPWVFYVDGSEPFPADDSLLVNPFQVRNYQWRDENVFTYHFIERGYGKHHVILADVKSRNHRVLIREDSDTYIFVRNSYRYDTAGGKEIIWSSERDGWNHLYLYDGETGEVNNQITKGEMTVHEVIHVDEKARKILFSAGGEVKGRDPYYKHYYWVNFDGSGLKRITNSMDNHKLEFSENYELAIDTLCGADRTASFQMIDATNGKVITQIGESDASKLLATGWTMPESFMTTDRDGKFEIWGTIHRPANFNPNKSYPVIECIYAGPHGQFVAKTLRKWSGSIHELTMRGFIVVRIDGKGTNLRCKEFSHFCYKNLVDAGLPDRIKWIKEAAKKYPYMDVNRVGIYGGSAGGQSSTGAVLHHGDFYKAAFSDCGCHDNRVDKIWWNEQWMDWPVGPHYKEQSNVTNAHKLTGKLFLCVGELDKNVDPASTMQVADALVKAGKDFDLLIIPGMGHGCAESDYGKWRRAKFFMEHLGGAN